MNFHYFYFFMVSFSPFSATFVNVESSEIRRSPNLGSSLREELRRVLKLHCHGKGNPTGKLILGVLSFRIFSMQMLDDRYSTTSHNQCNIYFAKNHLRCYHISVRREDMKLTIFFVLDDHALPMRFERRKKLQWNYTEVSIHCSCHEWVKQYSIFKIFTRTWWSNQKKELNIPVKKCALPSTTIFGPVSSFTAGTR